MTIDVQAFMQATHQETIGTARIPLPVGEYTGQIDPDPSKMSLEQGTAGDKAKNPGAPWARLDINIQIPDPSGSLAAATGRTNPVVRYGIMLDLNASGMPDFSPGKNINLGRLFKAIGHPVDSKGNIQSPWSFTELPGKPLKITIAHDPNPNDPANPYERVSAVTSA